MQQTQLPHPPHKERLFLLVFIRGVLARLREQ